KRRIDVAGRDDADLGGFDDRERLVVDTEAQQTVSDPRQRLRGGWRVLDPQARRGGLLAAQDCIDQAAAQLGARTAELHWRQVGRRPGHAATIALACRTP